MICLQNHPFSPLCAHTHIYNKRIQRKLCTHTHTHTINEYRENYTHTHTYTINDIKYTENTEAAFSLTTTPTNPHTANNILTNIILQADKHHIPKAKCIIHASFCQNTSDKKSH